MSNIWEPCPRCGSNRVEEKQPGFACTVIGLVFTVYFFAIANLAGFIIFGLLFIVGIIRALRHNTKKTGHLMKCEDCKNEWRKPYEDKGKLAG